MNQLLDAIFQTRDLAFGADGVEVGFARPIPAWAWLVVVLAAGALGAWSYRRIVGARWARVFLAGVRSLLLIVLALLACGPRLVLPQERLERDWTIVLVDRSASMTIPDEGNQGDRLTREQRLREAILRAEPNLRALEASRQVLWLGFGAGVFDLPVEGGLPRLEDPDQRRTALGSAIDQALRRASGRIVSSLVIISDGRSADDLSPEAIRRLQSERIRVITMALGSPEPLADLALTRVEAPREAFVDDPVSVSVRVEKLGAGPAPAGSVQLVDRRTGIVLDQRAIDPDASREIVLTTTPEDPERADWLVRLALERADLTQENNQREIAVALVDRPLRVVYFDGYPRWEYRYVKNLLLRERSIRSSALLLATNRRYIQEGDEVLARVPASSEEWAEIDVIVLGDMRPEVFSPQQLEQIRDHVAQRGGGLIWIGGSGPTPAQWRGTPLEDLLPFTLSEGEAIAAHDEPVTVFAGSQSERLGVMRLGADDEERFPTRISDPRSGWSRLWFAQRIDPASLKPTSEVVALCARESDVRSALERDGDGALRTPPASATPLVITMRFGAGRVVYVATDETWRWRFGKGESLQERFWIPLVRLPGRESLGRSGRGAILDASPARALVDEPVRFTLRLVDQRLADAAGESVRVRARRANDPSDPGVEIVLRSTGSESSGLTTFEGTWSFASPGDFAAEAGEAWLAGLDVSTAFRVEREDSELRRPEADHEFLASIRARSVKAGLAGDDAKAIELDPSDLPELANLLPVRDVRTELPPTVEPLWDRWVVLLMVVGLFTLEWVARKLLTLA